MTEAIEATADEIGTEIVPANAPQVTLLRTDDPVEVLERSTRVADALKNVLVRQNMIQSIQGKDHVKVEGWVTLGAMLGVVPVVTWTRKLENGWEARVEARTLDGRVVGAAEAECLKDENRWRSADDYAVRSMAQTRATSKALGGPLRFIVTLAGYEGTPVEEMDGVARQSQGVGAKPTDKQKVFLRKIVEGKAHGITTPTRKQLVAVLAEIEGAPTLEEGWVEKLTMGQMRPLLDRLSNGDLPPDEGPPRSDVPSDGFDPGPAEPSDDEVPFS